jgi:hypothetical protein
VSAGEIWTHYRDRGLRGTKLRHAVRRHAYVIQANDPKEAAELLVRVGKRKLDRKREKQKPRPLRPLTKEKLDPVRMAWLRHDKERGLA